MRAQHPRAARRGQQLLAPAGMGEPHQMQVCDPPVAFGLDQQAPPRPPVQLRRYLMPSGRGESRSNVPGAVQVVHGRLQIEDGLGCQARHRGGPEVLDRRNQPGSEHRVQQPALVLSGLPPRTVRRHHVDLLGGPRRPRPLTPCGHCYRYLAASRGSRVRTAPSSSKSQACPISASEEVPSSVGRYAVWQGGATPRPDASRPCRHARPRQPTTSPAAPSWTASSGRCGRSWAGRHHRSRRGVGSVTAADCRKVGTTPAVCVSTPRPMNGRGLPRTYSCDRR